MNSELISAEASGAVRYCMKRRLPFAIVFLPRENCPRFYSCSHVTAATTESNGFVISPFGIGAEASPTVIQQQYTIADLALRDDSEDEQFSPNTELPQSTDRATYIKSVERIIANLSGRNAKVVISRIEVIDSCKDVIQIANDYFNIHADCFRALYFTPETGIWIVATPEVLVTYNYGEFLMETMSLAGTRRICSEPWDEKNIQEHQLVTDYIADRLTECGLSPEICQYENLRFGDIEHLCNRIHAVGKVSPIKVAESLSPTPAVGGWPINEAIDTIRSVEQHSRGCYGGFIGINDTDHCRLYVNLRSCNVIPLSEFKFRYVLYAGGGINALSVASDEWEEAGNKMQTLKQLIEE